jgi:Ca2+-transporting ATPase
MSISVDLNKAWHALAPEDVARELAVDSKRGLKAAQAAERLKEFGRNALSEKTGPGWSEILVRQFQNVLILVLILAAGLSLAVGDLADAVTILAIVVLNSALGFAQEWKAERALKELRGMLSQRARAIRDGAEIDVDAECLVPGDVVLLATGDIVPADLRLAEAVNLRTDEAALTGESGSVKKAAAPIAADAPLAERASIAWMGSSVTNGHATGIVVGTGPSTEFGRIARLAAAVDRDPTPLQRQLGVLGRQLGVLAIVAAAGIGIVGWLVGRAPLEMAMTAISLAVAIVPEGLPAVVTITLAVGAGAMVKRRALLRRLQAAETLGGATVICTDKTGTLTKNEMTVTSIWLPGGGVEVDGVGYETAGAFRTANGDIDPRTRPDLLALLETGLICNHARIFEENGEWRRRGEPTEAALVALAAKAGLERDDALASVAEFSFNSSRKRMAVVAERGAAFISHVKGAPEVILERSLKIRDGETVRDMTESDRSRITEAFQRMAQEGLRTLALARRDVADVECLSERDAESGLTFLGVVGIIDPPRAEAKDAVALARRAGVKVVMITGDSAPTAQAVARRVGISASAVVTGQEIAWLTDDELRRALASDSIFARATPEDKMRIVRLLQGDGHVVAMTGDGVNDAPALKRADVGIAMGLRGADVAKAASDVVLTDDNFASIVGAVEEGRRQYDNIRKFVRYLLSSNVGEVVAIFLNIALGGPLILIPVQILWMNLVTDGLTALALGLEPAERDIMQRPPHAPSAKLLDRAGIIMIAALGGYIGVAALLLFQTYLGSGDPEAAARAQTVAFTALIIFEKFNVFNFKSLREPLWRTRFLSNPALLAAVGGTLALQAVAVYTPPLQTMLHLVPLRIDDWLLIGALGAPVIVLGEAVKAILRHRLLFDAAANGEARWAETR